jgi:hypothetical protein
MGSSVASQVKPVKKRFPQRVEIDEDQDFGEEINEIPNISNIKCSISSSSSSGRKIALSDLVNFDQIERGENINDDRGR